MQEDTFYQIRRELHQHPELSGHEARTARFAEDKLQAFNPTKIIRHVGGHGLLVEYFFSEDGPTVLFRADIDAVAVQEPDEIPHHSQTPGVAHKCGHDGHTTILLRFARMLSEHPLTKGRILLLSNRQKRTALAQKPCWTRRCWTITRSTRRLPCTTYRATRCTPFSARKVVSRVPW